MTPQRQIPETLGEVMVDVFAALETVTVAVSANAVAVADLVKALHERPTRQETGRFLALVLALVVLLNVAAIMVGTTVLRGGQRQIADALDPAGAVAKRGQASTALAICSLKNENAMLHGHPEGAPGCSPADLERLAELVAPPAAP